MTDDLKTISDALGKLQAAGASEDAKRTAAMTAALQSISAALTDLVSIAEGKEEEPPEDEMAPARLIADAISEAMAGLRIEASEVRVEPTINVAAPIIPPNPVALTVMAGENHSHINVQPADVTVIPATWKTLKVDFDYRAGGIVGATITRA